MLTLLQRRKPKVRYITIQGYRIKNTTIPSWIYEKPIPDFDELLREAKAKQRARFFEFLHRVRELKKQGLW